MKAITTTVLPLWADVLEKIAPRRPEPREVWTVKLHETTGELLEILVNWNVVWSAPSASEAP